MADSCLTCDYARFTPSAGKVGCELLTSMEGTAVFGVVGKELKGLWHGKVHHESYPNIRPLPTSGFAEKSVVVGATDRCSRFKPRAG
jgi:hypothetical protein